MEQRKSFKHSMLEHAALQQRSGKTLVSYAKLIGVSRHKMHYWVRKYKSSQKTQKSKDDTSLKFIDLGSFGYKDQPVNAGRPAAPFRTTAVSPPQEEPIPQMTLTFPNGICLKIY